MYSTKNIEKILIANTTNKKPVLARKFQYINEQGNNTNIIAIVNYEIAPDTIFIYYHKTARTDTINWNKINKIFKDEYNLENFDFYYNTFVFNIKPKTKTINTPIDLLDFMHGQCYKIPDIYTNEDIKKILKDLIKNDIITEEYKLVLNKNKYLVKDILSNKNTPIKYSKNGNLLLFHGTTKENWESIKKNGGLRPNFKKRDTDNDNSLENTFKAESIYLTASLNTAKSYATSFNEEAVVLLVEVPDMSKLMPDDWYMHDKLSDFFRQQLLPAYNFFNYVESDTSKDIVNVLIKTQNIFPNMTKLVEMYEATRQFATNGTFFVKAIVLNDFSMIEKRIITWKYYKDKNDEKLFIALTKEIFELCVKKLRPLFFSPKAIRESLNNKDTSKNAVAYRGRIPLSYIHGVFDINGNKIE